MKINTRNIISYLYSTFLITIGLVKISKEKTLNGERILSIYFHDPEKNQFEFCINWLIKNGFNFITIEDVVKISNGEKKFPKGSVLITVDDGWIRNKENIFNVANKYNIPITIFITTDPVIKGEGYWWSYINKANKNRLIKENANDFKKMPNSERESRLNEVKNKIKIKRESLDKEEVIMIADNDNYIIGSHTVTHPILPKCDEEVAKYEIEEAKFIIEEWIKKPIKYFAFPNGSYTEREINILKNTGYSAAFTTENKYLNRQNISNLFKIPRFEVLDKISNAETICRMTGVWFENKLKKFITND